VAAAIKALILKESSENIAADNNCTNGRVSDKLRRLPRHQRTQAHNSTHTVSTSVLFTGYVVNKTVSCVLMKMILVATI
jgi:hypothetical protein